MARVPGRLPEPGLFAALAASLVLHLLALTMIGLPQIERRFGGAIPLTVRIGERPRSAPATQARSAVSDLPAPASPKPVIAAPSPPPRATIESRRPQAQKAAGSSKNGKPDEPDTGTREQPPTPGQVASTIRRSEPTPSALLPGQVSVLLVLSPAGAVEQIIWKRLPALTPEALLELERRMRSRTYPEAEESRAVNETIDVFAVLRGR